MTRTLALAALLAVGCTSAPETFGEACVDIAEATCDWVADCAKELLGEKLDRSELRECVDDATAECCGDDGTCGQGVAPITDAAWRRCLSDIRKMSCTRTSDAFPASCQIL